MRIDAAGEQIFSSAINFAPGRAEVVADSLNQAVLDTDIADEILARIYNRSVLENQIRRAGFPYGWARGLL